jgi:hypothetical protein
LSICTQLKAGTFLKYFILAVVAFNLAIVAYVLIRGLQPKPAAPNSIPSATNSAAALPR